MNYQEKHFNSLSFDDENTICFQTTNMESEQYGFIDIDAEIVSDYETEMLDHDNQAVMEYVDGENGLVKEFADGKPRYTDADYVELINRQLKEELRQMLEWGYIGCHLSGLTTIVYNRVGMLSNRTITVPFDIRETYSVDALDMTDADYWHLLYLTIKNQS